jgi:hypothetical protein
MQAPIEATLLCAVQLFWRASSWWMRIERGVGKKRWKKKKKNEEKSKKLSGIT